MEIWYPSIDKVLAYIGAMPTWLLPMLVSLYNNYFLLSGIKAIEYYGVYSIGTYDSCVCMLLRRKPNHFIFRNILLFSTLQGLCSPQFSFAKFNCLFTGEAANYRSFDTS